jgi:uncharacterized protein (TIRG00374 family)
MNADQKTRWIKILRWSGTIILLGWLLTLIDLRHTVRILTAARLDLVAAALAVLVLIRVFMAWRWMYVLTKLGIHARFLEVFRITMVSIALGLVMPGGHAAVDAYRTWSMSRLRGSVSLITASVAADRVFGLYSLVLVSFLATLLVADIPGDVDWRSLVAWTFLVASLITVAMVVAGPRLLSLASRLFSWWPRAMRAVERVASHLHAGDTLRRIAIPSTMMALPVQILRGVEFYLIFKAIGVDIGLIAMLIYSPLVFLLMLLPVSVAGLGIREGSFYLFLTPYGVSVDEIVAAGAIFHVLGVLLGLPGALWVSRSPVAPEAIIEGQGRPAETGQRDSGK